MLARAVVCLWILATAARADEPPAPISPAVQHDIDRAYELIADGKTQEAGALLRRILEQHRLTPQKKHQVLAQLGHLYARTGRHAKAIEAFEAALAIMDDASLYQALGYSRLALDQTDGAIAAFEQTLTSGKPTAMLNSQLGYLYKAKGQRQAARAYFVAAQRLAEGKISPDHSQRWRREVRNLSRPLRLTAFAFHRAGSVPGGGPGLAPEAVGQSQLAIKGAIPLPDDGGHWPDIRLFARAFWALDRTPAPRSETGQAGIGASIRPFSGVNLAFDLERFVKLGRQSRNDWLARARFSTGRGYEAPIGQDQWPYWSVYADAAVIGLDDGDLFGAVAAEGGYGFRLQDTLDLIAHGLANGLIQDDAFNTTSLVEIGAGLRLIYRFGDTAFRAPHRSVRLDIQWRRPVAGDSRNANGLTLTLSTAF